MKLIINSFSTNIQEWFHLRDQHIRFQRSKRARSFQLETGPKEDRPHGIAMHSNGNTPPLVIDFQTVRELEDGREGPRDRWNQLVFLVFFCASSKTVSSWGIRVQIHSIDSIVRRQIRERWPVIKKNQESIEEHLLKNIHLNLSELEIRWIE